MSRVAIYEKALALEAEAAALREFVQYIADSPEPDYGGFSREAVERAKAVLGGHAVPDKP